MNLDSDQIVVRLPEKLHQELTQEASESSRSIEQLLVESAILHKILRELDPWPGIQALWERGKNLDSDEVEKDVATALMEVRQERKQRGG